MRRAALAAAAALMATAAAAQDRVRGDLRYAPDPTWLRIGPSFAPNDGGRVRIVTAAQGAAALTLEQFYAYERLRASALARLSMSMPVAQAEPRARSEALAAILARHPEIRVAGLPLAPILGPDLSDRPLR